MRSKVSEPFQVCHNRTVHKLGEVADVQNGVARKWVRSGWAVRKIRHLAAQECPSSLSETVLVAGRLVQSATRDFATRV
jgi:hypothetical protein